MFLPGQFLLLGGKKFKVLTNSESCLSCKMMSSVLNFLIWRFLEVYPVLKHILKVQCTLSSWGQYTFSASYLYTCICMLMMARFMKWHITVAIE